MGRITVAVNPAYTSQNCSNCGTVVKKSLSTRTHSCKCGFELDRDGNAAINILNLALGTTGHVGTWILNPNASGDSTSTQAGVILSGQVESMNEESSRLIAQECQRPTLPKIPSGFSDVFVYGRSQGFSAKLAKMQNSKIELLSEQKTERLWVGKLVKE